MYDYGKDFGHDMDIEEIIQQYAMDMKKRREDNWKNALNRPEEEKADKPETLEKPKETEEAEKQEGVTEDSAICEEAGEGWLPIHTDSVMEDAYLSRRRTKDYMMARNQNFYEDVENRLKDYPLETLLEKPEEISGYSKELLVQCGLELLEEISPVELFSLVIELIILEQLYDSQSQNNLEYRIIF